MTTLPDDLLLNVAIPKMDVRDLFDYIIDYFGKDPAFDTKEWTTPVRIFASKSFAAAQIKGHPTSEDFDKLGAEKFVKGFSVKDKNFIFACYPLKPRPNPVLHQTFGITEGWRLGLSGLRASKITPARFAEQLAMTERFFEAVAREFSVRRGEVRRQSKTYIGPDPALVEAEIAMSCLPVAEIEAAYDDLDTFWASWDKVTHLPDGMVLLSRGMEIVDETTFKVLTMTRGMVMARAAKPGLSKYYLAEPSPEERTVLDAQPSYLEQIGYSEEKKSLEFTAVVPEGEYLSLRDLDDIMRWQSDGAAGGKAVETVIVTFPNIAMAQRQAPALHAIEARVQYYAEQGDWRILEP